MCELPKPRLITGIGAISAARVSFHLTMLDEPTKSTWQLAGGATRSASTNRSISVASSCSRIGAGSGGAWAPARAIDSATAKAHKTSWPTRPERKEVITIFLRIVALTLNFEPLTAQCDTPFPRPIQPRGWANAYGLSYRIRGGLLAPRRHCAGISKVGEELIEK